MDSTTYAALMFLLLFLLIFAGIPVSLALIGTAFLFALPLFQEVTGILLYNTVLQTATQYMLSAAPPFIFMGAVLEKSGIAEQVFYALRLWLHRLPGGLGLATIGMGGIFAATTGIVGAVEVVIGMMAIPAMLACSYKKSLVAGTICAGGSLGTMVPPSLVLVIYASVAQMSVGKLFAAVFFPALIMVGFFLAYVLIAARLQPSLAPSAVDDQQPVALREKLMITLRSVVPAAILVTLVLGSILFGIASPTEAASVGALGALVLTFVYGKINRAMLRDTFERTLLINAMIMLIVVAGTMFTNVFRIHQGDAVIAQVVTAMSLQPLLLTGMLLLVVFIAGFVLDWVSVVLICLPIFIPLLNTNAIDPLWFAVLMSIVIQTSYLTPPMAPSIFYLRSIAPPEIGYRDMYAGVMPFVGCQLLVLVLVILFPGLATLLPSYIK